MTEKPTYEELEKRVRELERIITDHSLEDSESGTSMNILKHRSATVFALNAPKNIIPI